MKNYTVFISILISLLCFNVSGAHALKNKSKTPLIITLGVSAGVLLGAAAGTGAYYILRSNRAENMTEADRVEREINLAECIEDLDGKLRKAKHDNIELNRYTLKQKAQHDRTSRYLQNYLQTNQVYLQRLEDKIDNTNEMLREAIYDESETSSVF